MAITSEQLNQMNAQELTELKGRVDAALTSVEARQKSEALLQMQRLAAESGYTLEDLFQSHTGKGKAKGKSNIPPKYAHPENPEQTWVGRGKQPAWFKEYIEAGGNKDDLLIVKPLPASGSAEAGEEATKGKRGKKGQQAPESAEEGHGDNQGEQVANG